MEPTESSTVATGDDSATAAEPGAEGASDVEPEKAEGSADFRAELGINEFESMRYRDAYE